MVPVVKPYLRVHHSDKPFDENLYDPELQLSKKPYRWISAGFQSSGTKDED